MKISKNELQDIILGNEQTGSDNQLKTAQSFLRRYAEASSSYYGPPTTANNFIGEGAEQNSLQVAQGGSPTPTHPIQSLLLCIRLSIVIPA